jgi:hypothetical protein
MKAMTRLKAVMILGHFIINRPVALAGLREGGILVVDMVDTLTVVGALLADEAITVVVVFDQEIVLDGATDLPTTVVAGIDM